MKGDLSGPQGFQPGVPSRRHALITLISTPGSHVLFLSFNICCRRDLLQAAPQGAVPAEAGQHGPDPGHHQQEPGLLHPGSLRLVPDFRKI